MQLRERAAMASKVFYYSNVDRVEAVEKRKSRKATILK